MKKKIFWLATILILAFSTSVFADGETGQVGFCGETGSVGGETGSVGGETGQVGFCGDTQGTGGETGVGNLFQQFLDVFSK